MFAMTSRAQPRSYVVLSVLGLFALLSTTGLVYAEPEAAGWHPHHGHLGHGGLVVAHSHPWDTDVSTAGPADGAEDIIFTPANDGSTGSSISMPRAYVAPALPQAPDIEASPRTVRVPRDQHPPPLAEPPRA
jgi:hypothetical protein